MYSANGYVPAPTDSCWTYPTSFMLTEQTLDRMRREADPLADAVAADVIGARSGGASSTHSAGRSAFAEWTGISGAIPRGLHDEIDRYLDQTGHVPDWHDAELVARGEVVYGAYGPECMIVLLLRSLPAGYVQAHIASTLHSTARMTEESGSLGQLTRRVLETLQFLIYVMAPRGLQAGGVGIQAAQRVRLIHAAIRTYTTRAPSYDPTGPAPINQEELLMTMLTFSVLVVDGLRSLGVTLEPADEDGILHMWRLVGHQMGIREEYMPTDMADARAMWEVIYRRNWGPTPEGVELTSALLDYVRSITPWRVLRFAPGLLLRYLNGQPLSRELGVRSLIQPVESIAQFGLRLPFAILSNVELILRQATRWSRSFNLRLLQGLLLEWNDRKKVTFDIPPSLRDAWGMK
jgi:hypothetical protein